MLPTVIRQGSNQAVNFTCYQAIKDYWMNLQGTNLTHSGLGVDRNTIKNPQFYLT